MKKAVLASVMATVCSGAAMASSVPTSTDAHFNRVEARYVEFDDYKPDVYGLSGRVMLNDDFYLTTDYFHHSYSGASLDQLIAGIGYKHDLSESVSLFADVNAGYADGSLNKHRYNAHLNRY